MRATKRQTNAIRAYVESQAHEEVVQRDLGLVAAGAPPNDDAVAAGRTGQADLQLLAATVVGDD